MLEYKIIDCKGKHCDLNIYNETYKLWYKVWSDTYHELINLENMSSDQFLINDNAAVILWQKKPVALFLMSIYNPEALINHRRSYILNYPQDTYFEVIKGHSNIAIYSNITVHPDYRKSNVFIKAPLGILQFSLACELFKLSNATLMLGVTHNSRKINQLAYEHGATSLKENQPLFNVKADYVAFYKENLKPHPHPEVSKVIQSWFKENQKLAA